jgi:arylsulfatase A-like enzyme
MKRPGSLNVFAHFCFALSALLLLACAAAAAERPPNVVIFVADDSGWGDYSFTGNTNVQTPSIDSIARSGAVAERFYVCPLCAPTRAEFLTGRYHSRVGVRGVSTGLERLNVDEKTLADSFHAAGYVTGAFGKWHNGSQWPYHPNARGFDEYYGFTSGHWGEYFDPPLERNGKPVRGKGFIADDLTDHAISFIEMHHSRPFVCYLPFNTPHSPWAVPKEYWQRFRQKPIGLRASDPARERLDETRCALAMMENLDFNVGRVLKRLEELGLNENTIVVYFSDNGPNTARWNGGMKGIKGSTDEGGVRSVLFLQWIAGGIRPGTVIRPITAAIDLLPTLTALAGISRVGEKPLDGRDLSPLLLHKNTPWIDRMIFSRQDARTAARSQRYLYKSEGALFDLADDPEQSKNVASANPDVVSQMARALGEWRREMPSIERDLRPYPVGHSEFPRTPLPARDGIPHGTVRRSAGAPNCSYFVNWTSLEDRMTWDIEVQTEGDYEVEILYTCPVPDAGSIIELNFLDSTESAVVTPGWDSPLYANQDTLPRPPGESKMKEFRTLAFGTMHLEEGRGLLTLRARKIAGRTVMEVRQINLTLKE